jgi:hypothetical protein
VNLVMPDKTERMREHRRRYKRRYPERVAASRHRFSAEHPEKARAYNLLKKAIQRGHMTKPDVCSRCAQPGRIEGHHEDYAKPLDVLWLCNSCHQEGHGAARAALAPREPCDTCKGTRVAPVADEDLGGEGITMSSCPDCVL